jgi:hypothetical protein
MKKKHQRRFMLKRRDGKLSVQSKEKSTLPMNPRIESEELLEALIEVEALLSPTLVQEHVPLAETIAFLADGIAVRLTGKNDIHSHELRAALIRFILLVWSQGIFTPSPAFPYTYEQVIEAFHVPLMDGMLEESEDQSPPSHPQTSTDLSPDAQLKHEMRDVDLARDALVARGRHALDRKQYTHAEQYLREAVQADMLDESEACYFLATTRMWQRDLNEASYLFEVDSEDREGEAPLSYLLAIWGALCASSTLAEYLTTQRDGMEEDGDPLTDHQEYFAFDYEEYDDEGIHTCASAFFAYLRGEASQCLDLLEHFELDLLEIPAWFVCFWQVMAMVELGQYERAQAALRQTQAEDIPPLFLLPLRWFEQSHPLFFESTISPLFTSLNLWKEIEAANARERQSQEERQKRAQWWITHHEEKLPGFSRIEQALSALRDGLTRGDVPFRSLTIPNGEAYAEAYLELVQHQRTGAIGSLPVFLAEVPPPRSSRPATYLVTALLEQLGDPLASKRDSEIQKRYRLIQLLRDRNVELAILTHVEHLTTPSGTKILSGEIEWIRHLFANEIKTIPLVLVGPAHVFEQMQTTNKELCLPSLVPSSI